MGNPKRKASDYLDSKTKDAIKNSILFLRKSGLNTDEQIFDRVRRDFDVSITAIKEISGELHIPSNLDLEVSQLSNIGAFAYVLISCELNFENEIISKLIQIDNVTEAKGVFGEFDIFVKLDAKSEEQIAETIAEIRKIPHITSTNTLTSIPSQGGRSD